MSGSNAAELVRRQSKGGSLTGLLVGLVCLLLGLFVAQQLISHFRHKSRCEKHLQNLASFVAAIQDYQARTGSVPPGNFGTRDFPKGLELALAKSPWLEPSPFGGSYVWISPLPERALDDDLGRESPYVGAIGIQAFPPESELALTREDLAYLREQLDTGRIPGASHAVGFTGWPLCKVKPRR